MNSNTKMNKPFMEIPRKDHLYRSIEIRKKDFDEVEYSLNDLELCKQAKRCMNCGIPFCHGAGCPLGNLIPDFNRAVVRGDWKFAWDLLGSTSSFPEFTSRICPALCEGSCTSGLEFGAVSVRQIEKAIVDHAFANGWIKPVIPQKRSGKKVAIIGAGPAGLALAAALNAKGHQVVVYEKKAKPGGLLRYGIPAFKLAKSIIDRRISILERSGIEFVCGTEIGRDISAQYIASKSDAVVLAIGTPRPRDLIIPGRDLSGIHFALDLLSDQNRVLDGEIKKHPIEIEGKRVLVIGGGDTGSDCVGTSIRLGASSVMQIEIMPKPPELRSASTPWPNWPYLLRTSSSHEEGCERRWSLASQCFHGSNGHLTGVEVAPVVWTFDPNGRPVKFEQTDQKSSMIGCNLVFLAMGFLREDRSDLLDRLGFDSLENKKLFLAGDSASGPSLVVRAIADARNIADQIDRSFRIG